MNKVDEYIILCAKSDLIFPEMYKTPTKVNKNTPYLLITVYHNLDDPTATIVFLLVKYSVPIHRAYLLPIFYLFSIKTCLCWWLGGFPKSNINFFTNI